MEVRVECDEPRKRKKRYAQAHQAHQMVKHQGRAALIGKPNLGFASTVVFRSICKAFFGFFGVTTGTFRS
jgi:hypothetical protein